MCIKERFFSLDADDENIPYEKEGFDVTIQVSIVYKRYIEQQLSNCDSYQ